MPLHAISRPLDRHARCQLNAARKYRSCRPIKWQPVNETKISVNGIRDRPLSQYVMAKCDEIDA